MKLPTIPLILFLSTFTLLHAVPVNVALNQPVVADSTYSPAYPASKAVDGNSTSDASRWLSTDSAYPHWIEIDLEQSYALSQMKFWTGKNGIGPFPLYDFSLQYWNGTGWTDLYSETASTNTGTVDVSFGPTLSGNRIRLTVTNGEDSIVRLFELEVYGESHGLTYNTLSPANGGTLFDPASDVVVSFDAAIAAGSHSGIRIENLDTQTDVTGISAMVSGSDLVISHGGLNPSGSYAVHVPEGVVGLGSDGITPNGALYWEFATAPLKPQLANYTNEIPNLTDPITLTFDRDISVPDISGVTVEQFSNGTALGGLGYSVSGSTLTISHDTLVSNASYVITLSAGTVEGIINGETNDDLRILVYAGSTALINTDFDTGLEGFNTGHNLGLIAGTSSNIYWKWTSSGIGPDYDSEYLTSDTNYSDDFVVSPVLNLTAGRTYTLDFHADLNRALHVGLSPTASLDELTEIDLVSSGGPKSVRIEFDATTTGPQYLLFFSGDTNPWQNQAIDTFLLTESVPPLVRITGPTDGSSHLESDSVPVEIEAYGIAGEISSVELFDNEVSLGTLSKVGGSYPYTWDYHTPGTHTLRVEVTDSRGNVSTDEIMVTLTFDDGTLPEFIGYDFDDGAQGWSFSRGIGIQGRSGEPGQFIRAGFDIDFGLYASSPELFLLAGESYTVQFKGRQDGTAQTLAWAFIATPESGYPTDVTTRIDFTINTPDWKQYAFTFSVPVDGAYHLTLINRNTAYNKINFDDVRLLGNFNSVPFASLDSPDGNITTIAGVDILLEATASDTDGAITDVSFWDANLGSLVAPDATDSTSPYSYIWNNIPAGNYAVYARALDDSNATVNSPSRKITVAPNQYSISSYLGGSATDEAFTGAVYLSDGTLVMSGIIDPNLFPGVTPVYLNGTTVGDRGIVARFSEDGQTCLSVTVVGTRALDIDTDGTDRIFIAAGDDGVVVLDNTASVVLWSNDYGAPYVHRIDAADGGTFGVLTSSVFDYLDGKIKSGTNYVYNSGYVELGSMGGIGAFTRDVAVDEISQTVVFIGWKNITHMEDDSSGGSNPVDIPGLIGRAYDGTEKWRGYDWGRQGDARGWLNEVDNNMADTRGCRVIIGPDGKLYAGIEFDGGNTPLRYDPLDVTNPVSVVGGDNYHTMANTSTVPKTFVGVYDTATGNYQTGQWITNRQSDGSDNTIRIKNGNLYVDDAGRIHVVGGSASGMPLTHNAVLDVDYTGGAYHLVYSPDFTSREYVTRLTLSAAGFSNNSGIAVSPSGTVGTAGFSNSPYSFLVNEWQSALDAGSDAHFAVGQVEAYYKFQTGDHPRLFFDDEELAGIRSRLDREPYASMYTNLVAKRDYGNFYRFYDSSDPGSLFSRAQGSAFIYALSGDETYAQDARDDLETALTLIDPDWADPGTKGLTLYSYATELAISYDLCAASDAWDAAFNYQMSRRLVEIAEVIVNSGGTEQPSSLGSNWKAARGGSAGLAYLATDHAFNSSLADSAEGFVQNYLNTNQAPGSVGWNPEGFGYTAYAIGNFVGPYGVAADRASGSTAYQTNERIEGLTWSGFTGATTAYNVYGLGGVKTDWSDDNAHTGGEGTYGLAFYYADEDLKRGIRHAYDRFMGTLSPFGPDWDGVRQGSFWSILFYDDAIPSQSPSEIWDWHRRSLETGGTGTFTYRNSYADENDILVQFKTRLDDIGQAHDGPDGLGFRLIGLDDAFVVGGGRDLDFGGLNQATLYPSDPNLNVDRNENGGTLSGTPLVKHDGSGHVIASMGQNNVGTSSHKRWFVTDFDSASTGAEATIIVADISGNGLYWQLPTFLGNTITHSGNTFTITGTKGATLKGTILHPGGTPAITVGTKARGSGYTLLNGGDLSTEDPFTNPRIEENRYLYFEGSGDGDFLVVLTLVQPGRSHPSVSHASGGVADAIVQVGSKNYALQSDDVLYSTGTNTPVAYSAPNATITFDADGKGILGGAAIQSVPYGGSAVAPVVLPMVEYTFMGWDKSFTQVVKSMTVTALYDDNASVTSGYTSWIGEALWGLDPAVQDPGDNPDFDLYDNLMEYVLGLNPSQPDGNGVISVREEGGRVILSYRVHTDATDFNVTPKYASSLTGSWTDVPGPNIEFVGVGIGADPSYSYTLYEASMPIDSGPVFLILEVRGD